MLHQKITQSTYEVLSQYEGEYVAIPLFVGKRVYIEFSQDELLIIDGETGEILDPTQFDENMISNLQMFQREAIEPGDDETFLLSANIQKFGSKEICVLLGDVSPHNPKNASFIDVYTNLRSYMTGENFSLVLEDEEPQKLLAPDGFSIEISSYIWLTTLYLFNFGGMFNILKKMGNLHGFILHKPFATLEQPEESFFIPVE